MDALAQSGYAPCESLMDALGRELLPEGVLGENRYQRFSGDGFGPASPDGALLVADIWRAIQAGKRDAASIALFCCPRGIDQDEDS